MPCSNSVRLEYAREDGEGVWISRSKSRFEKRVLSHSLQRRTSRGIDSPDSFSVVELAGTLSARCGQRR